MNLTIEEYPLSSDIADQIASLAEQADALFIGEIHGTQEIPRIVAGLLPMLYKHGYRGLGVEVPHFEQKSLCEWLFDPTNPIPGFYSKPWPDGRGSREMLALIRRAGQIGFQIFCFDPLTRRNAPWSKRDAGMAQITDETWRQEFPNDKVILICGNNHAFLKPPPHAGDEFWPSFAEHLRGRMPEKGYRTINIMPAGGEFFNMGIRQVHALQFLTVPEQSLAAPRIVPSELVSLQVDFPVCHAATFLSPPKAPGQLQLLHSLWMQFSLGIKFAWERKTNIR